MNTLNLESNIMIEDKRMKPAYIEQMLMWMTIFVSFVWLFFFVLHYATAVKLNENMDAMSNYAAKYVSLLTTQTNLEITNDATLISGLNNMKLKLIGDISAGEINCVVATSSPENENSQSIFIIQGTYNKGFLKNRGENNMVSKSVVYNQSNSAQITCTLTVTIN